MRRCVHAVVGPFSLLVAGLVFVVGFALIAIRTTALLLISKD